MKTSVVFPTLNLSVKVDCHSWWHLAFLNGLLVKFITDFCWNKNQGNNFIIKQLQKILPFFKKWKLELTSLQFTMNVIFIYCSYLIKSKKLQLTILLPVFRSSSFCKQPTHDDSAFLEKTWRSLITLHDFRQFLSEKPVYFLFVKFCEGRPLR